MSTRTDLSKIPSISGNNGYSLRCPEVKINGHEAHCSYTVCQHTILAYKEKRLPATSFQSCAAAIAAGKCQALKMMVEEIRKGEQLYFIDMAALIKEVEEQNDHARTLNGTNGCHVLLAKRRHGLVERTCSTLTIEKDVLETGESASLKHGWFKVIE